MDSVGPEQEQQPKSEIVHLNQEFQLFDPTRTEPEGALSKVTLITENLPPLPWLILASDITTFDDRVDAFTPFDYEEGARIIYDQSGIRVQQGEKDPERRTLDDERFPYLLFVEIETEELEELGILDPNSPDHNWVHQETLDKYKNLRFQVYFPNGLKFEARINELPLTNWAYDDITFGFDKFYPLEIGFEKAALDLVLPDDMNELSKIKGKFVMAGEEGTRTEVPDVFNEDFDQ